MLFKDISYLELNTQAKVVSPDRDTKQFMLLAGALQEDTLAHLFIIVLDYALRQAIARRVHNHS